LRLEHQIPAAALALVALVAAAGTGVPKSASAQQFAVPAGARATLISQTNAYRQQHGLAALRQSAGASRVAQAYATYLARTNKTGHSADGRSPRQRLAGAGVEVCHVWENWHRSWTRPKPAPAAAAMGKAMRFWKSSPGHERALRSAATEIGAGVAGWKHGARWIYTEVLLLIDTSCR
jgi:uncharacterized protein YkwD